ncbi:MAG: hypothetical protein LC753_18270 [Acidobacteria bacterium]|nr:hypothetical protein [Acidobacteriota bacterium]
MAACSGSSTSTSVVGPTTERCAVAVSAPAAPIGPGGGTGTISVDTARECQWSASAEATWLSIMSGATGQGTSTVPFSAAPNRSTSARRGTIAVNGQRAEITQEAATCSGSVSPATVNLGPAGDDDVQLTVTEQEFCAWTAVSRVSWISVTSGGNGTGNGEVRLNVAANTGPARTGSVDVAGREVVITQAAAPAQCTFSISPASLSTGAAGGTAAVTVTASPNCAWAAISEDPWIAVSSGATGVGGGTVTLQVSSNSGSARTGRVTIAGQTYTVTQAGAAASCSYSISPASASVDSAGASQTVSVTATNGCAWSAVSNVTWIVVTGAANGTGNGSVTLTVAPNAGGSRTGTVTIAGQTYSVTQSAAAPPQCTFTVAPESVPVAAAGGSPSVDVTTGSSCTWSVSTSTTWITFSGGSSRTGSGAVQLTVASNTGSARTGTVSIAGRTVSIEQAGAPAPSCSFSINPTSASPPAAGGSTTVAVTTTSGCTWTTTGAPSWITVTGGSGAGNGSVTLAVQANTGTARTATLTIAGQSFVVTQAAAGATCTYSINPTSASPPAAGGSTTVAVTATAGCAWTTTGAPTWITVTGGSGTGNGSVTLAVQANTGAARTATLTIAGQSFVVTQAAPPPACSYSINPTSASPTAAGGSTAVAVTTTAGCSWTTTGAPTWITVTGGSGTGNGSVTLAVQANTGAP